jgi:hypothetical protein
MRKITTYLFCLIFFGCAEDPFVSKEVIDELLNEKYPKLNNIVYLDYDNRIFYIDDLRNGQPKEISTLEGKKDLLRITVSGEKIAFINQNGNPVIIDKSGKILNTLEQYRNVVQMDWSFDSETLYMLIDDEVVFFGPQLDIPEVIIPLIARSTSYEVLSLSISPNLDIAYMIRYFHPLNGYILLTFVLGKDNSEKEINTPSPGLDYGYVRFSKNGNLVVAYAGYESDYINKYFENFYCFLDVQTKYPTATFESDVKTIPMFRSDLNYVIFVDNRKFRAYSMLDYKYDIIREDINPKEMDWK